MFPTGVRKVFKDHSDHHHGESIRTVVKGGNELLIDLFERVAGEFMVLGFLAFCVWSCNQNKGFADLHNTFGGPPEYDMLHLFEGVHMYLFIAMVLNFCLNAYLIYRVVNWQVLLASYEHENLVAQYPEISAFQSRPPAIFREGDSEDETSKAKFKQLETYFLEVTGKDDDGNVILGKDHDNGSFEFSRYLALCLDQILADVIEFSWCTWVLVMVLNTITAICADNIEYATYGGSDPTSTRRAGASGGPAPPPLTGVNGIQIQQACIGGLVVVVAYAIVWLAQREIYNMRQCTKDPNFSYKDVDEESVWSSVSLEHYCSRCLQALMFNVCYGVAKHLANKGFWKEYSGETGQVILFIYYIVIFLFTATILFPEAVFTATVALALPPHVDEQNMKTALACQEDALKRKEAGVNIHVDHGPTTFIDHASEIAAAGVPPDDDTSAAATDADAVAVEMQPPTETTQDEGAEKEATP